MKTRTAVDYDRITIAGPSFKRRDQYLSKDGDNPNAPWPGYGWPLGTECWYFVLDCNGLRKYATGLTVREAWHRAVTVTAAEVSR